MHTTEILAHRGFWNSTDRRPNTFSALHAALQNGFGIETDIRLDLDEKLVISHDPLVNGMEYIKLSQLLEIRSYISPNSKLALNIKEDGLHPYISKLVEQFNLKNYFLFDMSVPDYIAGSKYNLVQYCRVSEYESAHHFIGNSNGIWLDYFEDTLFFDHTLKLLSNDWCNISIVSPELHGKKSYHSFWRSIFNSCTLCNLNLSICTDFPLDLKTFIDSHD